MKESDYDSKAGSLVDDKDEFKAKLDKIKKKKLQTIKVFHYLKRSDSDASILLYS